MSTENPFFAHPILNSPYECPIKHWELDLEGQPTQQVLSGRRVAEFITPIPKPRKRKGAAKQGKLPLQDETGISTPEQQYEIAPLLNQLRGLIHAWRKLPSPSDWGVTPETARLLQHWRHHDFQNTRPFFCQVEAAETAIWLTEVAPKQARGKVFLEHLANANAGANRGLQRLSLKLATGAGKTTVMAMLIAWQTINAVRRPNTSTFTRGFLVVTPGLTIKDRLRVLQPNDLDSYYRSRELVPTDMLDDLGRAKIVITNYHSFKLRDELELSTGNRRLLGGREGALVKVEPEGKMLQRVMPELMGIKNILVVNDEAHHCYREKPGESDEEGLAGEDKKEAEHNREAARLWMSGLETVQRKLGIQRVIDLSATPFFLRGSGYAEGTLFPWTMSDFSLMDAIECGIVKLPRVPVADNIPGEQAPVFRNLWEYIRKDMPKKGRGKSDQLDPLSLPRQLCTALDALYGHYKLTFDLWKNAGLQVPPCFIIVCNNTSASKLVFDYISGFFRIDDAGEQHFEHGRLELFRNYDENGNPISRPRTLLIDSEELESGEALDPKFREAAKDEIERFRQEKIAREGNSAAVEQISEQELLREVMNTVGKRDRLGESIRCVVSVSMLTEGWDTNTVTHVLGVRAFGTQLLCEQVIGRALRRESYQLNEEGLFNVEYADILGIPFDFTAKPVVAPPQPPRETIHVRAIREREHFEISFPRVLGYRVELPEEKLSATFNPDSTLVLNPDLIGPTEARIEGIVGEGINLTVEHLKDTRISSIGFRLTAHLVQTKWRESSKAFDTNMYGQLRPLVRQWLDKHLVCEGGTYPTQVLYPQIIDMAAARITDAVTVASAGSKPIKALLDPYNPTSSTRHVNFNTSKTERWETKDRCHINWIILDSNWESEFCRVAEFHPRVRAYVKNHNLGFEVPYLYGAESRMYRPDFIVLVDDGRGEDDPLHLVVEIKGYRGEDAKDKKRTMDTYWVPGVNNSGKFGRWAFVEFTSIYAIESEFAREVEARFGTMIETVISQTAALAAQE